MDIAIALINAAILGTPIVIGLSWWSWFRTDREYLPAWRVQVLLAGLVAVSANAFLYYAWLVYTSTVTRSDLGGEAKNILGNYVAIPLLVVALTGAIACGGKQRVLLAIAVVMGFFLWIPVGFL